MEWKLSCGEIVLIDEEDYNRIDKNGWYLSDKYHGTDATIVSKKIFDVCGVKYRKFVPKENIEINFEV